MADRLSVFSNPEVIRLVKDHFIPVAQNDWYARRRDDALGRFFRGVADQGPRTGEGGSTRQGIYALTASGKLLGYNNNRPVERKLAMLREALAAWENLPEAETKPGAVEVPALDEEEVDPTYHRRPPEGGLVLRAFTRALEEDGSGRLTACQAGVDGTRLGTLSALDHVWIREDEWRDLVKRGAQADGPIEIPAPIATRLARFHLVDNTRGEPPMWQREEIHELELTARLMDSGRERVVLSLEGSALLATSADPAASDRGYEATLKGVLEYERGSDRVVRFDLVAVGDHWGEGPYTRGARPGRTPLGVAFELADGTFPGDDVPPQASTWLPGYYEAERH